MKFNFAEESMKAWDYISLYETHMSRTDCWALLYCAQCCDSMKRMVLKDCKIPSEQFSMILPVLHKAEILELTLNDPTDSDLVDLMCALTQRRTLKPQCVYVSRNYVKTYENCSVRSLNWSFSNELFSICIVFAIKTVVESLSLTVPCSEPIDWTKFFQIFPNMNLDDLTSVIHSVSNVKRVELFANCLNESLCVWALSLIQKCPSLTELWIDARFLKEECISILQRSQTRPNCTSTFKGLRCNKQSQKCTLLQDYCLRCNEMLKIYVNSRGFAGETSSFKVQVSQTSDIM